MNRDAIVRLFTLRDDYSIPNIPQIDAIKGTVILWDVHQVLLVSMGHKLPKITALFHINRPHSY